MASEPVYEEKKSPLGLLLAVAGLIILGFIIFSLAGDDDEIDVVDTDPVLENDFDEDLGLDIDNPAPVVSIIRPAVGVSLAGESARVTEVISDRLFRIGGTTFPANGVLMYLDDSLDLGDMEDDIVVNVGDRIAVSGQYQSDLSNQTLEADESNQVNVDGIVFVVDDIDFQ